MYTAPATMPAQNPVQITSAASATNKAVTYVYLLTSIHTMLVAGLAANTSYSVSVQSSGGGNAVTIAAGGSSATTDAAGVLKLSF